MWVLDVFFWSVKLALRSLLPSCGVVLKTFIYFLFLPSFLLWGHGVGGISCSPEACSMVKMTLNCYLLGMWVVMGLDSGPSSSGNSISWTTPPAQTLISLDLFSSSLAKSFPRLVWSFKVQWVVGGFVTFVYCEVTCLEQPVLCGTWCLATFSWVCFLAIEYFWVRWSMRQ